jgi:hypothetical protein
MRDLKKCFPPILEILRQARDRVKGGVLCRRSETLTRSAACRIPYDRGACSSANKAGVRSCNALCMRCRLYNWGAKHP